MCVAEAATAVKVIGTGLSVVSALRGGKAQGAAYDAQAAQIDAQARQKVLDAQAMLDQAHVEAGYIREQVPRVKSAARAAYAESGVMVTSPTAGDVEQRIEWEGERDALNAILLGTRQKQRAEQEAAALRGEAGQLRVAGRNAVQEGRGRAVGSLLGGIGDIAAGWRR